MAEIRLQAIMRMCIPPFVPRFDALPQDCDMFFVRHVGPLTIP